MANTPTSTNSHESTPPDEASQQELAGVNALMEELRKRTEAAMKSAAEIHDGLAGDTIKFS